VMNATAALRLASSPLVSQILWVFMVGWSARLDG
jgi:hypothetical protein